MRVAIQTWIVPWAAVSALIACSAEQPSSSTGTSNAAGGGAVSSVNTGNAQTTLVPMSQPVARTPSGAAPVVQPPAAPISPAAPVAGRPAPPVVGSPVTPPSTPAAQPMAAPSAPATPAAGGGTWNTTGTTCLKPGSGQFNEPGPYQVGMMDVDLGMVQPDQTTGKFTIFYPMPLEAECLHPIVVWGNGTGVNDSTTYAFFNNNAASWGMVVIASHDPNTGSGAFHKAGIDYLLKQNDDSTSMFHKKLSPRAGTSGHSQGAFGSVAGASHPNVSVNVGVGGGASGAAQHASLCLTGTEDIAAETCPNAVDRAQGPFFTASWNMGDHFVSQTLAGYISRDPGTLAMQRLYAAWFRCFLADDSIACNLFKGAAPDDCGVCKENQDWAVLSSKNIP